MSCTLSDVCDSDSDSSTNSMLSSRASHPDNNRPRMELDRNGYKGRELERLEARYPNSYILRMQRPQRSIRPLFGRQYVRGAHREVQPIYDVVRNRLEQEQHVRETKLLHPRGIGPRRKLERGGQPTQRGLHVHNLGVDPSGHRMPKRGLERDERPRGRGAQMRDHATGLEIKFIHEQPQRPSTAMDVLDTTNKVAFTTKTVCDAVCCCLNLFGWSILLCHYGEVTWALRRLKSPPSANFGIVGVVFSV